MSVPLMHQWHDSCVGEWFLTPSLWLWSAREWVRGEWMHPRFDICYLYIICIWWCGMCAIHVLHNPLRSPLCYHLIFWGLPSGFHMRPLLLLSDLFWARGWNTEYNVTLIWDLNLINNLKLDIKFSFTFICTPFSIIFILLLWHSDISFITFLISVIYFVVPIIYLFTGLFKLSRVFFFPRQVSKLGSGDFYGNECWEWTTLILF